MSSEPDQHRLALGVAALAAAAAGLWFLVKKRSKGANVLPDGATDKDLIGLVGWTSRICAAARALETAQPDRMYADPLAKALAGEEAMAFVRDRAEADTENLMQEFLGTYPDAAGRGEHRIGRFGIRVKYLDEALLRHLAQDNPPARRAAQVVLLGAGMDTRAWRMELPSGVKWFEVDVPSVLDVKRRLLARLGADMSGEQEQGAKFPLRAASYAVAGGDLADGAWADALRAAGWDASAPTVFLAEGLTRYLKPAVLEAVFRTASRDAGPGSTMIATMSSMADVLAMKERSAGGAMRSVNDQIHWGFPDDPAEAKAFFEGLGWWQTGHDSASSSARAVCGPYRTLNFDPDEESPGTGYVFFIAHNVKA